MHWELIAIAAAIGILWLYKRWVHWESYKHHKPQSTVELVSRRGRFED